MRTEQWVNTPGVNVVWVLVRGDGSFDGVTPEVEVWRPSMKDLVATHIHEVQPKSDHLVFIRLRLLEIDDSPVAMMALCVVPAHAVKILVPSAQA